MKSSLLSLFVLTLSTTTFAADYRIGYDYCKEFTKESVDKGFDGKTVSGEISRKKNPPKANDSLAYLDQTRKDVTKSLSDLCDAKKDNVTTGDLTRTLESAKATCLQNKHLMTKPLFDKPFLADKNLYDKMGDLCQELLVNSMNELEVTKKGMALQAKMNGKAAPDCSGVVSDSARGQMKPIIIDLDKLNAEAKAKKSQQK